MHRHGDVDATKIGIVVRGGQVLLWGSVTSEQERTLAGQIAARLTGRTAIINQIQVFSHDAKLARRRARPRYVPTQQRRANALAPFCEGARRGVHALAC